MSVDSPLSPGQAVGRWLLYVVVFTAAGGLAAGVSSLLYQLVSQNPGTLTLYAIIFAAGGFIAYRQAQRVVEVSTEGDDAP